MIKKDCDYFCENAWGDEQFCSNDNVEEYLLTSCDNCKYYKKDEED